MLTGRATGLAVLFLLTAAADCEDQKGACTTAGCVSGIRLAVTGNLPPSYSVTLEVLAPGGLSTSFRCSPDDPCLYPRFVERFAPDRFRVRLVGDGLELVREFRPAYEIQRPNGRGCDPVCRHATVVVDVD